MATSQVNFVATPEDLKLMYDSWPENFACLFDMGVKSFERLFNHRPDLKMIFSNSTDDEEWRTDDRLKKIVLTLEQTLVQAVGTYADPDPDPLNTNEAFIQLMQELGGLHRAIVPKIQLDNFELLFKLIPEVIVDVVTARQTPGPLLPASERARILSVWTHFCAFMSYHFCQGWERNVIPKLPKLQKAYRFDQKRNTNIRRSSDLSNRNSCDFIGKRRGAAKGATIASRHRANRSGEEDEVASWQLERGQSEPIVLHDVMLQLQELDITENKLETHKNKGNEKQ